MIKFFSKLLLGVLTILGACFGISKAFAMMSIASTASFFIGIILLIFILFIVTVIFSKIIFKNKVK